MTFLHFFSRHETASILCNNFLHHSLGGWGLQREHERRLPHLEPEPKLRPPRIQHTLFWQARSRVFWRLLTSDINKVMRHFRGDAAGGAAAPLVLGPGPKKLPGPPLILGPGPLKLPQEIGDNKWKSLAPFPSWATILDSSMSLLEASTLTLTNLSVPTQKNKPFKVGFLNTR